jgi:NitT/TauT family transport system ATP-binding protein
MDILKAEKISLCFDNLEVLNNISFDLKKGEFLGIVGPLGCGKTSLLKVLGGLIKPNKGKAYLNGKIAFVFQKANLMPWRTVFQNITLPLEIKKISKEKTVKKALKILKLVNLEKFKDVYPNSLSGGMEQLTAISRAFISEADILLLDEPFASLDAITREKMNQQLLRLWQKKRKTIVLVTHSITEAIFLSDRILVMSQRPGTIKSKIKINFKRPRKAAVMNSSGFNQMIKKIKRDMK